MLRPDASAFAPTLRATPAAEPLRAAGAAAPASFRALHDEIVRYVHDGGPAAPAGPAGGATTLGAEAAALRLRTADAADAEPADADARRRFVDALAPLAREAGARLGVAPEIITAQAALESGWGRRPLRGADGADSHNLFGIKAGAGWSGERVAAATTEHDADGARATVDAFRRYGSVAESVRDFTRLLQTPRYRGALDAGGDVAAYAAGLARGGYASDPRYGEKLGAVVRQLRASGG